MWTELREGEDHLGDSGFSDQSAAPHTLGEVETGRQPLWSVLTSTGIPGNDHINQSPGVREVKVQGTGNRQ
jgi:hypothetical protein